MSTTTQESVNLSLSRTFPAPRERVFAAWTDPEQVVKWFGPETCRVRDAMIDLRVGGTYRFQVSSPQCGETAVYGQYREVTPPGRLVYTWKWESDPDYADRETLVTVEFIDRGGSTELRLTHENLPNTESGRNHEHGWNGCFDKLANLLAS
jgi:uncharacterized protein YndB with AHSA1/START domain